jgi:hypothetical protein
LRDPGYARSNRASGQFQTQQSRVPKRTAHKEKPPTRGAQRGFSLKSSHSRARGLTVL